MIERRSRDHDLVILRSQRRRVAGLRSPPVINQQPGVAAVRFDGDQRTVDVTAKQRNQMQKTQILG